VGPSCLDLLPEALPADGVSAGRRLGLAGAWLCLSFRPFEDNQTNRGNLMAGTAKLFSRILHDEIDLHAAWLPIANNFQPGDYGLISDGVLVKMGNVAEFGVSFVTRQTEQVSLDFSSKGTRVIKFVGDAEVTALPSQPVSAKLAIEFQRANSFLMKAQLRGMEMETLAQVARALAQRTDWNRKHRVVNATFTGEDCVILSSREANTKVEISGKADALQQFDLGKLNAGFTFGKNKEVGLELLGKTGVVGLRMFKLKSGGQGQPEILGVNEQVAIDPGPPKGQDLEDDV
jgi:hypothetical protein